MSTRGQGNRNSTTPRVPNLLRIALANDKRDRRLAAATFGLMLHQASEAAVPILIGIIIDRAIEPGSLTQLLLWIGVLGATFLVLSLSYQRSARAMVSVFGFGEHDLRQLAASRVLHPRGVLGRRHPGELLSIATSDTGRVAGIAWSIAQQAATVTAVLSATIALLVISVPLGVGVGLGAVLVLLLMQWLARPLERAGSAEQAAVGHASEIATDALAGLRVIHGLGAQAEMQRRYGRVSTESRDRAISASRLLVTYQSVSTLISIVYLAVLALAAGWLALQGRITPGQLVTVVGLAQFLQGSLAHVGTFGANWAHKRASSKRLRELLETEYALPAGDTNLGEGQGSGGFDASPVLLSWTPPQGAPLEVHPSDSLLGVRVDTPAEARAISAALGFRTPLGPGELQFCGTDACALGPERMAACALAPPHDAALFTGTLRENVVRSGSADLSDRALAAAELYEVLDHLGHADAPIGAGGRRLSGGQRQRVLLARALHSDADVVVLDEPTSALDPITEQRVADGLRGLGRPIVVVTSSPILLAACARVVDGRAANGRAGASADPAPAPASHEPHAKDPS
ncbi:ABC transporter transmembrane domain-containing protein [Leucobacter sp. 1207-22]|uniref:ABC transporter transmembrane domain-containing protein n=1 Tax=Leucobacter sp. 1207-22 TaxID=2604456 RepID=UPI004062B97F